MNKTLIFLILYSHSLFAAYPDNNCLSEENYQNCVVCCDDKHKKIADFKKQYEYKYKKPFDFCKNNISTKDTEVFNTFLAFQSPIPAISISLLKTKNTSENILKAICLNESIETCIDACLKKFNP